MTVGKKLQAEKICARGKLLTGRAEYLAPGKVTGRAGLSPKKETVAQDFTLLRERRAC